MRASVYLQNSSHLTIITLQELAPFWLSQWLLWYHRAIPSTTLDEVFNCLKCIIAYRINKCNTVNAKTVQSSRDYSTNPSKVLLAAEEAGSVKIKLTPFPLMLWA